MEHLVELNDIAGLVLREGAKHNAPPPVRVSLYPDGSGWEVELQLQGYGLDMREKTSDVAVWAEALGACVSITEHAEFVNVAAVTRVNGRIVRVWQHLTHHEATGLAALLDCEFGHDPIEVTPAVLGTAFEVHDDATATFAARDARAVA